jgi:uncharacterized membrane protein YidH (DUF202 family)
MCRLCVIGILLISVCAAGWHDSERQCQQQQNKKVGSFVIGAVSGCFHVFHLLIPFVFFVSFVVCFTRCPTGGHAEMNFRRGEKPLRLPIL